MRSYYVYAVEVRRPGDGPQALPRVYVGSSAFTPEERLRRHHEASGARYASRYVRRFGGKLLPALYAHLNRPPFASREEAKAAEKKLRGELERRGYRVYGSCMPHGKSCRL